LESEALIAKENLEIARIKARAEVTTEWAKGLQAEGKSWFEALDMAEARYDAQIQRRHEYSPV